GEIEWNVSEQNRGTVCEAIARIKEDDLLINKLPWVENIVILQGDRWSLNATQLLVARRREIIKSLPKISDDEIDDRNKGDFLVKGVTVLQIAWLIAQLITRAARQLPVSQLEVTTLSYSICAIMTFAIIFSKPRDIRTPIRIKAARYPTAQDLVDIAN